MPFYENVYIARQDISTQQAESLSDQFAAAITEHGGTVTKREYWGLRNLAYRIKKNRKGHYTLFNIDAPWVAVQEMERQMRLNEDVLRHLTVRVEELEEGPSAILASRSARDERGGRGGRRGRDGPPREGGPRPREDGREASPTPREDGREASPRPRDGPPREAAPTPREDGHEANEPVAADEGGGES